MDAIAAFDALKRWRDFANSTLGELVLWAGSKEIAAAVLSLFGPIVALIAYMGKLALDILASLVRSRHGRYFLASIVLTIAGLLACQHFEARGRSAQAAVDAITLQKAVADARAAGAAEVRRQYTGGRR